MKNIIICQHLQYLCILLVGMQELCIFMVGIIHGYIYREYGWEFRPKNDYRLLYRKLYRKNIDTLQKTISMQNRKLY